MVSQLAQCFVPGMKEYRCTCHTYTFSRSQEGQHLLSVRESWRDDLGKRRVFTDTNIQKPYWLTASASLGLVLTCPLREESWLRHTAELFDGAPILRSRTHRVAMR